MARAVRSGSRADFALLALCAGVSLLLNVPTPMREPVSAALRRTVLAPFVSLQKRAELTRAAFEAHDAVTLRADSLSARAFTAVALQGENERLRRLLGLASRVQWGFVPAEALHDPHSADEFTVALTAGAGAGVRPFSPVVAPEGLVGMVTTVDPQTSLAITWSHPDFRVSAKTVDGTVFGIVAAHLGSGVDRYLLEIRGVAFRNTLRPGTLIVSSGVGGVYPAGIPVGTVIRELKTAEGWARTYLMQPAVQPSQAGAVMILRPERSEPGVESAWASITNADSATRRVAAAGDSLVRDSVALAARATAAREARIAADSAAAARVAAPADSAAARNGVAGAAAGAPAIRRDSGFTRSAVPRPAPVTRADSIRRDSVRRAAARTAPRVPAAPGAAPAARDSARRVPR